MSDSGFLDLGFARPDTDRAGRTGFGEVIYCAGKTPAQAAAIFNALIPSQKAVLGTRATPDHYEAVRELFPEAIYSEVAKCISCGRPTPPTQPGSVVIISAGTSDLPVANEAAFTLEFLGHHPILITDCGVAGIHRLLVEHERIDSADVVIVVAGMEGALPSVIGGLTGRPLIAVPTSVGYGSHFGGLSPLLGMLNSCAPGLCVVNIDNGFGAALAAARILKPRPLRGRC
jgi:NCAIR mutase (PurE)-related protein